MASGCARGTGIHTSGSSEWPARVRDQSRLNRQSGRQQGAQRGVTSMRTAQGGIAHARLTQHIVATGIASGSHPRCNMRCRAMQKWVPLQTA